MPTTFACRPPIGTRIAEAHDAHYIDSETAALRRRFSHRRSCLRCRSPRRVAGQRWQAATATASWEAMDMNLSLQYAHRRSPSRGQHVRIMVLSWNIRYCPLSSVLRVALVSRTPPRAHSAVEAEHRLCIAGGASIVVGNCKATTATMKGLWRPTASSPLVGGACASRRLVEATRRAVDIFYRPATGTAMQHGAAWRRMRARAVGHLRC